MKALVNKRAVIKHGVRVAAFAAACATSYVAVSGYAKPPAFTKGTIPKEAFGNGKGGAIDVSLVPDFVASSKRDGSVAGYVRKQDIFAGQPTKLGQPPAPRQVPVYDDNLERVVGHMVTGKGFVPLGSKVEDAPMFRSVTAEEMDELEDAEE